MCSVGFGVPSADKTWPPAHRRSCVVSKMSLCGSWGERAKAPTWLCKRFKNKIKITGEKGCENLQVILLTSPSFPSPRRGAGARSRWSKSSYMRF